MKQGKITYNTKDACIGDGILKEMLRADQAYDWRLLCNGSEIPTRSYSDQPFLVRAHDGALVCVVTTGTGHEGSAGQHVAVLRSLDHGKTWSDPIAVESPENPESSYAVLLKVPSGRLYCFYNYNADNIREMEIIHPGNPVTFRVDTLGHHVFKYSDDHGKTWSSTYYEVPIRETEIDRQNIRKGKVRFMWNVGRPFVLNGSGYISVHKVGGFGEGFIVSSEGWLMRSDNILTEPDPAKIRWETLPDGERGLCAPKGGGKVSEEQSYAVLSDGSIYCVYRTVDGYPVETYSRDGGHTWSEPQYKCYADGRNMKHPRAANFIWKCKNGKYLYWFHNHGGPFMNQTEPDAPAVSPYEDRNPAWVSAGIEKDGPDGKVIDWSQPEIMLYDDDVFIRMSYPDMIELDSGMYVSETQKNIARIHRINPVFIDRLWGQFDGLEVDQSDCILAVEQGGLKVDLPALPKFSQRDMRRADQGLVDLRQGFTLLLKVTVPSAGGGEVLLDNRTPSGRGWMLELTGEGTLRLLMSDKQTVALNESESGMLLPGQTHAVAIVVDGGPKIVSFVIDGKFCDGGTQRQFGWSRFSPNLRDAAGHPRLTISQDVQTLKIFSRALMTCEIIALQKRNHTKPV
ncbi:MAG: sialidase family protein [Kiritimatiellales bacterium]